MFRTGTGYQVFPGDGWFILTAAYPEEITKSLTYGRFGLAIWAVWREVAAAVSP